MARKIAPKQSKSPPPKKKGRKIVVPDGRLVSVLLSPATVAGLRKIQKREGCGLSKVVRAILDAAV